VAKLADATDLGFEQKLYEFLEVHKKSQIGDPRSPEIAPEQTSEWQSSGNQRRLLELEAAIANLTRLLANTDDAVVAAELVGERRAMRAEREALLMAAHGSRD
jgi:hypothetical protein